MSESLMQHAAWVLFVWVLANQAGVPVPVVPPLLAAGALAGGSLSFTVVLVVVVGAALSADLVWYGLGRWRGTQAVAALCRLLRQPRTSVDWVQRVFLSHQLGFLWSARFLPELNPVAAGLAGATRVRLPRFLLHAAGSALVWAGAWVGVGYLLGGAIRESPARFGIPYTVLIAGALVAASVSVLTLMGSRRRGRPDDATGTGHFANLERLRARPTGGVEKREPRLNDRPSSASPRERLREKATAA